MAKTRRIIRRLKLPAGRTFDDQLWPVVLALCVLAGFVTGSVLARLRLDDPRWYSNAVTWIVLTLLATAGIATALWKLDNRRFRRSMQLAILLGLFLHAVFFVATLDLYIFSRLLEHTPERDDLAENRQQVTVPNYVEMPRRDEARPDFERPVDVQSPQPELEWERLTREEADPLQRVPPQPTPVLEPEDTPQPSVLQREQTADTTPRHSDRRSQLSRRMLDSRPTPPSSQAAEVPTPPTFSRSAELQAQDSTPRRQSALAELAARQPVAEPSADRPSPELQMARRADQQIPETEDSATPTFQRQLSQLLAAPRTAVDLADSPAVSAATSPHELRPNTTLATRQATASPEPVPPQAEPVPDVSTDVPTQPQLRQSPTQSRPEVARTPVAVPNQRTRTTPRPDAAMAASRLTPATASLPRQPDARSSEPSAESIPALQPDTAPVIRATVSAQATRPQPAASEPTTADASVVTSPGVQRVEAERSSTPHTAPAITVRPARTPTQATGPSDVAEVAAPAVAAADSSEPAPAASQVAASRQTLSRPAPAASSPEAIAGASTSVADSAVTVEAPAATRLPRGAQAPQVAQSNITSPAPRQSATALPNATSIQADVPANLALTQAPSDQPRPSSASVARQQLESPSALRSQQAMQWQAASTSTQVGRAARPRIEMSSSPSVTPSADSAARPSRATLSSAVAASPVEVESPAVAAARQGVGEPVAAPARMAMSRSMTGTAGVGSGRNLDRARPSEDSPSLTASSSARRTEPMQDSPQGPALSPAAPALVRRSVAGSTLPSASLPPEPTDLATATAADRPAELAASASAVRRRSDAKAAEGPTTADRGTTEVDLGVTQIVSEGQVGRASGGGQPLLSFEIDSPQLARSQRVGGAPLAALAEPTVVDVPTAPRSDGGGQPPVPQTELPPTAVARTDPGDVQPISGGPSRASETGPPTEVSMAVRVADAAISRAELAEAVPGKPAAGGGEEEEDEEERRRRLVRAANRLAAAAVPTTVQLPGMTSAPDDDQRPQAAAAAVSNARSDTARAAGPNVGSPAEIEPGEATAVPIAESAVARAGTAETTPESPSVPADAATSPQRSSAANVAPVIETSVAGVELPASAIDVLTTDLAANPLTTTRDSDAGSPGAIAPGTLNAVESEITTEPVELTRAEAVDAAPGPPEIGGGTQTPTRAARGPLLAANLRAETVQIAGMAESGGLPDGSPIAAQGLQAARRPTGANAAPAAMPVGAVPDPEMQDAPALATAGAAVGPRSSSPSTADGPAVGQDLPPGLPFDRAGPDRLPFSSAAVTLVDVPDMSGDAAFLQASSDHQSPGLADRLSVSRETVEGGLTVNLDALPGPGGLGAERLTDTGLNHRRAATDSVQVQVRTARFVRQQPGGRPDFSTAAVVATEPFQRRSDRTTGDAAYGDRGAPPPRTEEAIELGLAYLSRIQLEDGSWSLQNGGESAALIADTAATGLALLAFQGAGYHHREHQYADVVGAGIQHLLRNQKPDGDLFLPLDDESNRSVWIYSHSIAALALSEAYGMTQDPALRDPAQRAIDFLVASQHPERGGWRYSPQLGSDTSVTGWAMMALKSGELASLEVPEETYQRIRQWLDYSQSSSNDPHLYVYNPLAPDTPEQRHGRKPSPTMTSVGLLMRLYLGWQRDHANMIRGAEYLAENLPQLGSARNPERDTYYWYYATQVMFHMGGDYWQAWNGKLHPLLVNHQIRQGPLAGSWDPRQPVPDRWAPHAGRLYVTTMNLLSLEVYYRYLPLYEDTAGRPGASSAD